MNALISILTEQLSPTKPLTTMAKNAIASRGYSDGVTRRARPRRCPRCNTWIITGLDADIAALQVACDPYPLTTLGEALAQLRAEQRWQGQTYALIKRRHYQLNLREAAHIARMPAGTPDLDVLRSHLCGESPPTKALTAVSAFASASTANSLPPNSPCPF